jgi:amidase
MDAPVDPEVGDAVERVAGVLVQLGHEVVPGAPEVDLAAIDQACLDVWFHDFDHWLDEVGADVERAVGADTVERGTLQFYEYARDQDPRQFLDALAEMNLIRRRIGRFFSEYDIWLTPTCAQVASPNGTFSMDVDLAPIEFILREQRTLQFLSLYNVTGQPAISLPLAQHSSGLPIGIQLGARPAQEHVLIELASALEEAMPWRDRRPELHVSNLVGLVP